MNFFHLHLELGDFSVDMLTAKKVMIDGTKSRSRSIF